MPGKACTRCGQEKEPEEYYQYKKHGWKYYRAECKECTRKRNMKPRKTCIKCGKTKSVQQFYDGVNRCKLCIKKYNKKSRTIACDECGKDMYKSNGHTTCVECRGYADWTGVACNTGCRYYEKCREKVKLTMFNSEDGHKWMPYCFESSTHHHCFKKVYGKNERQLEITL